MQKWNFIDDFPQPRNAGINFMQSFQRWFQPVFDPACHSCCQYQFFKYSVRCWQIVHNQLCCWDNQMMRLIWVWFGLNSTQSTDRISKIGQISYGFRRFDHCILNQCSRMWTGYHLLTYRFLDFDTGRNSKGHTSFQLLKNQVIRYICNHYIQLDATIQQLIKN